MFKSVILLLAITFITLINPVSAKAPQLKLEQLKSPPPKVIRICCAFGANIGYAGIPFAKRNDITSIDKIGPHTFMGSKEENNGIVYTRRGGFIDMGHMRDYADWTAYLYNLILASETDPELTTIHMGNEGGPKSLVLKLPPNLTNDEAIELAAKIAYDISLWHEISTWFGASYIPLLPERYSSFSPEDIYSNLMGTHLAIQALKSDLEYEQAMTILIDKMLHNLEVVSTWEDTFNAMVKVDNLWYDGDKRFPSRKITIKRFLDTDAALRPWQIPEENSFLEPYVLSKPDNSYSDYYEYQIRLNYKFPKKSVLEELNERVITQKDFPALIKHIHNDLNEMELKEINKQTKSEKSN